MIIASLLFFFVSTLNIPCDFEKEMALSTRSQSSLVQTSEDIKNLQFFKTLYEKNRHFLLDETPSKQIPKTFHYIWLGPRPFPTVSIEYLRSWEKKHPDWQFKFWTDVDREPPLKTMQKNLIKDFSFRQLKSCYDNCDNVAEKAVILCYEILLQEGGLYIDHDVLPFTNFDLFNERLDFYCALEQLAPTILSSSVYATHHILGSIANHPILQKSIDWLAENWQDLEASFSGNHLSAIENRVRHRSFAALQEGLLRRETPSTTRDLVFPATFLYPAKGSLRIANHLHEKSWLKKESFFEKKLQRQLAEIEKQHRRALLAICMTFMVNLVGWIFFLKMKEGR
ncbi:MAG: glycosyltransferase family 32 protein [Anaerolineae bacterium]